MGYASVALCESVTLIWFNPRRLKAPKTIVALVDYDDDDDDGGGGGGGGCDDDDDAVSDTVYKSTQCEGAMSPLMLSCPGSQRLLIRSAMFGRQDWNTTCPHDSATPTSDCASPRALDVVQTLCNGQYVPSLPISRDFHVDGWSTYN